MRNIKKYRNIFLMSDIERGERDPVLAALLKDDLIAAFCGNAAIQVAINQDESDYTKPAELVIGGRLVQKHATFKVGLRWIITPKEETQSVSDLIIATTGPVDETFDLSVGSESYNFDGSDVRDRKGVLLPHDSVRKLRFWMRSIEWDGALSPQINAEELNSD